FAIARACGLLALTVMPMRSAAQPAAQSQTITMKDSAAGTKAPSAGSGSVNGNATPGNAEILAELARMRARIAELEAQLKSQQSSEPALVNTAVTNVAPASTAIVAPPASPSTVAMNTAKPSQAAAQSPTQQKEAPSAPFAYADWTWLNGTPRNKD